MNEPHCAPGAGEVGGGTMRFVVAKSAERKAVLVLHCYCELFVRRRTMLVNAMRDHCAEFGLVAAQGVRNVGKLIKQVGQADPSTLPEITKAAMMLLAEQLKSLEMQIQALNRRLLAIAAYWRGTDRVRLVNDWRIPARTLVAREPAAQSRCSTAVFLLADRTG